MDSHRRRFGRAVGAFAATLIAAPSLAQTNAAGRVDSQVRVRNRTLTAGSLPLVKPRALRQSDTIGLIAPGGIVDDALLEKSVKNVESIGFRAKLGNNIRTAHGGYAGTVMQRLDDVHGMFLDPDVKAIWCVRGGSGCTALLPHIDYALVRKHPKIFIGYSDITALHLAFLRKAGLVTFHGPLAGYGLSDYSATQLLGVLMSPRPATEIQMSVENAKRAGERPEFAMQVFKHGVAEGRLVGGALSLVNALIGTPYAVDIRKSLLFLEDWDEAPYRIDRMLTQLQQSVGGMGEPDGFRHAAGVMLGVFTRIRMQEGDTSKTLTLAEVIDSQLSGLPIPAVYGYSFGHIPQQFTLPMGIRARLNTEEQTLTLLEPAVLA